MVTGTAAGIAGPAFVVGLVIAGIAALCNGLSSAQLAAVYPQSGGTYEYGYNLLNGWFGFSAGWMFLVSKLSAGSVVALGFGYYLQNLIPGIDPQVFAISIVVILTVLNCFGIKKAGFFNLLIVFVTVSSLLVFVIFGISNFSSSNLIPFSPNGISGILEASALLFFAFTGYARIATLGEEVSSPEKTIPKAILITIITAIILYVFVGLAAIGLIGADEMSSGGSPILKAAEALENPFLKFIIGIGAVTAMLGVLLSQILGISRMMFAMARKRDIPSFLEEVNQRYRVPVWGILLTGVIILLMVVFGTFDLILSSAAFTILIYYSITNISALKLSKEKRLYSRAIPLTGLIFCLVMAGSLPLSTIATGSAILICGFGIKLLFHRLSSSSK